MNINGNVLLASLILVITFSNRAYAQDKKEKSSKKKDSTTTEQKIEILAQEIEVLKAEKGTFAEITSEKGKYGLGPAASKVYSQGEKTVSIGGYGEMIYNNFATNKDDGTKADTDNIDFKRAIIYFGYKYSDWMVLNTEIEMEHVDEIYLEFAYVDFLLSNHFNIRAGLILIPMGIYGEYHEPTTYASTNRPLTETYIMPSTWRENGIGIFGSFGQLSYKAYLVNGFKGDNFGGPNGLRKGRQKGKEAEVVNFSGVFNLTYDITSAIQVGTSAYYGQAETGTPLGTRANTFITEAHIIAKHKGFSFNALYSYANIADAGKVSLITTEAVGTDMDGFYLELSYDVFRFLNGSQQFLIFGRYENVDTQRTMPAGFASNGESKRRIISTGFAYKPTIQTVAKLTYEWHHNSANTGQDRLSMVLGYIF